MGLTPKTIWVRAGEAGPCPLPIPIQGRRMITEPVEVELTRYIRRRLEVGDLVECTPTAAPPIAGGGTVTAEDGAPAEVMTSATRKEE